MVNLEGPIGTEQQARASSAQALFNGPGTPAALAAAGIVAALTANNHSGDGAAPAVTFGVEVVVIDGLRVAVTAVDLTAGVPEALAERLKAARAGADALVATFHVTGPPSLIPKPELEEAVGVALAADAAVIAAHGTHAIARVERRGDVVIAWGLGNLVFNCRCTDGSSGLVLRVELDARGKVTRAEAIPLTLGCTTNAALAQDPVFALQVLESLGSSQEYGWATGCGFDARGLTRSTGVTCPHVRWGKRLRFRLESVWSLRPPIFNAVF